MYGVPGISGIEAAGEIAAKLEANLNVKKKFDQFELPKAFFKNTDVLKIIQAEYSINHCTQAVRNLLCKGATQEKVREYCEAYVSTKGRYIPEGSQNPPSEKGDKAFGLYLFIQGPNKRSVDLAIAMIEGIIATGETRPPALMSLNTAAPPPGTPVGPQHNIQTMPPPHLQNIVQMQVPPPSINMVEKVPIGIDRPLPGFNLPMKLIGQNGSNLQYIRNETGAVVTLRGIGSAFIEPGTGQEAQEVLHFSIEHSKPEALATARELAVNLIATVQHEYAQVQASQGSVQLVHQPPLDQQIVHQPMLATSITLPVVQTASGFMQQPTAVPPPQFNHPPPPQLSLPPPGIHIPPQQGPLVPPPGHPPQQLQIQQHGEHAGGMMQQFQPGPQQQQQQQYLITQSGQPVQGIMTSQGFVVLNQQPQQVFLSQPPGQASQVIHQGQLAFQQAPAAVTAPVSYQLQYVQNQAPAGSPIHLQQQQQQQQHVVLQPPGQVQFQNGTVHIAQQQVVGVKPGEPGQVQPQMMQPGHLQVQVKPMPQTVQVMQPYAPTVQYMSSPGVRPDQTGPVVQKEPRLGKRKFTEEAEPQTSPQQQQQQSPQNLQSSPQPQQQQQQVVQLQMQMTPQQQQQQQMSASQQHQLMQQPPPQQFQGQQQMLGPQPVPHPSQTMAQGQQIRQGIGIQELMSVNQLERDEQGGKGSAEAPAQSGKGEGGEEMTPPPPPGQGNGQYMGQHQTSLEQQKLTQQNQWYEMDQKNRNQPQQQSQQQSNEFAYNNVFTRRERPPRDRPTFNHYSSKPQMYAYQSYMQQPTICPPPPPPPPPMQHQQQQHQQQQQQHYYYSRR